MKSPGVDLQSNPRRWRRGIASDVCISRRAEDLCPSPPPPVDLAASTGRPVEWERTRKARVRTPPPYELFAHPAVNCTAPHPRRDDGGGRPRPTGFHSRGGMSRAGWPPVSASPAPRDRSTATGAGSEITWPTGLGVRAGIIDRVRIGSHVQAPRCRTVRASGRRRRSDRPQPPRARTAEGSTPPLVRGRLQISLSKRR